MTTSLSDPVAIRVIGSNFAFDCPHILYIVEAGGNPQEGTINRQDALALAAAREALPIFD
jgi:hypothetical protein